jgi:hypothetical protein
MVLLLGGRRVSDSVVQYSVYPPAFPKIPNLLGISIGRLKILKFLNRLGVLLLMGVPVGACTTPCTKEDQVIKGQKKT